MPRNMNEYEYPLDINRKYGGKKRVISKVKKAKRIKEKDILDKYFSKSTLENAEEQVQQPPQYSEAGDIEGS